MIGQVLFVGLLLSVGHSALKVNHHQSEHYGSLKVTKSDRNIMLNGAYPEEINKVTLQATAQGEIDKFEHVVPADLYRHLAEIKFEVKRQVLKYVMKETADGAAIYQVELNEPVTTESEKAVVITTKFIGRYRNLPKNIGLLDDQLLEYTDYVAYYSPYNVDMQTTVFKFQKMLEFSKSGQKDSITSAKFINSGIKAFNNTKVTVHGVNNEPQILFSRVDRVVEVSHWGNIAITEKYGIYNSGPGVSGQFSRVEFNPYNPQAGRNAWRSTNAVLPYETWGLYFRDEVGNISTSKAYRDSKNVRVEFTPRYALLGGWKCNWEIGYNLPTKGYLYHEGENFQLRTINFGYELEKIIAQKFTFTIVLPEGATDYKIIMDDQEISFEESKSFWFLDYTGKPTLTVSRGITSKSLHRDIKISYRFSKRSILKKPFIVFLAFFSFCMSVIFFKRLHLKTLHQHSS